MRTPDLKVKKRIANARKLPLRFVGKPLLFDAAIAHRERQIIYLQNGTAVLRLDRARTEHIPKSHQYDLTQATIFGLNDRLTLAATSPILHKGQTLRDTFNKEWERYNAALEKARGSVFDYGVYAYYSERNDLVRYCEPFWHRVVSVASSSKLISDPAGKLSWQEIREIFSKTTVAVAGGSVGSSILHSIVQDLRPEKIKIADKSLYKMENINRVRLNYWDMVWPNSQRTHVTDTLLKNKALVTATQVYAIDPYIDIFVYPEGINTDTIQTFLDGDRHTEPPVQVIVEEIDDPRIKIFIREEARRRGIPLVMATDLGSAVQLDIMRYDLDRHLSLTHKTTDQALYRSMQEVYDNPGNRKIFFRFVDALIGRSYRQDELKKIIEGKSEVPTSTMIPQLGSTSAMAGAIVAEAVACIRLGHTYPKRVIINKRTFKVSMLIR